VQDIDHRLNTWLTKCGQPPRLGPSDTDSRRAERQRFENIRTATDSTVDKYGYAAANRRDNFG
jgi:hypothetical protein